MTKPTAIQFDKSKFGVRNVAKHLVRTAVQYKVHAITANLIADYTRFDADQFVVKMTAHVVAWGVADNVEPYTDKLVDKTMDFASERYAAYQTHRQERQAAQKNPQQA